MKKEELKQLIREAYREVISESTYTEYFKEFKNIVDTLQKQSEIYSVRSTTAEKAKEIINDCIRNLKIDISDIDFNIELIKPHDNALNIRIQTLKQPKLIKQIYNSLSKSTTWEFVDHEETLYITIQLYK